MVSRANLALDQGNFDDAVHYLRLAVQRAPLRAELRDALFSAIEQQKARKSPAAGPRPMRKPAQPLFDNPIQEDDARAEIEEVPGTRKKPASSQLAVPPPKSQASSTSASMSQKRPMSETAELFGQADFLGDRGAAAKPQSRPQTAVAPSRPARRLGEGRAKPERAQGPSFFGAAKSRTSMPFARLAVYIGAGVLLFGGVATGIFFVMNSRPSRETESGEPKLSQVQRDDAVLLARAEDYLKERQYTLAFEQIERMSENAPKSQILARTYGLQADEFFSGKRYEEARRVFAKAAEAEPSNDLWHFHVGWCSYMMGLEKRVSNRQTAHEFFNQAETAFKAALGVNPNQVKALHGLGKVEVARNNRPAANEYYQKVLQVAPDSPEAMLAKGDLEAWGLERSQPPPRETVASAAANSATQSSARNVPQEPVEATKPKVKTEMTSLKTKL